MALDRRQRGETGHSVTESMTGKTGGDDNRVGGEAFARGQGHGCRCNGRNGSRAQIVQFGRQRAQDRHSVDQVFAVKPHAVAVGSDLMQVVVRQGRKAYAHGLKARCSVVGGVFALRPDIAADRPVARGPQGVLNPWRPDVEPVEPGGTGFAQAGVALFRLRVAQGLESGGDHAGGYAGRGGVHRLRPQDGDIIAARLRGDRQGQADNA